MKQNLIREFAKITYADMKDWASLKKMTQTTYDR